MKFNQAYKMAIKSIWANKMRSFLTMLGIIIGVSAVIMLISLVQGGTNSITKQIEDLGTNLITVTLTRTNNSNRVIKFEDLVKYTEGKPDYYSGVAPLVSSRLTAKVGTEDINTSLEGSNEVYSSVRNIKVTSGRFINALDVERRQNVAIVGTYIVSKLFKGEDPIGKTIKLNGQPYTVIGVLEEKAKGAQSSADDKIIIPYTKAAKLLRNMNITTFFIEAAKKDEIQQSVADLKRYLFSVYNNEDSYSIQSQDQVLDMFNQVMGTMSAILVGIAAISLVVGGIGIMNIMLVSVTERTREIGIRKAIGAKRGNILVQFLIEAIMVSCFGGIIGIILGVGGAVGVGNLFQIEASTSVSAIVLSFAFSVVVGVFFGWYPANKASKLNPIEALRHE